MSIELYVVLAVILIGWYVLNMDSKPKKKEVVEIKTTEEIMRDTTEQYKQSMERINKMYEDSRKRLSDIHKEFKNTSKGEKANAK